MPKIAIGIQCRSDSKRLPNKVLMEIRGQKVLDYIYKAAFDAAKYLNRQRPMSKDGIVYDNYDVEVYLLTPKDDPINAIYKRMCNLLSIPNHDDVLSRYIELYEETNADFIVRLTADCVHMPTHLISRAIKTAVIKNADYVSNVVHRTSPEGFDVEVLSPRMLMYLNEQTEGNIKLREHVTLALVQDLSQNPDFYKTNFKIWHLFEHYDFSAIKTSIDTMEEYLFAKRNIESVDNKKREAAKSGFISE